MTMELVARCFAALDLAIAHVAQREFVRLCQGLGEEQIAIHLAGACAELKKLQRSDGKPPDYANPWVVLLYLLWYQPGQTYLAYRIICDLAKDRVSPQLHVVDVGCGAIATEIALRIATATGGANTPALPLRQSVVHSIDLSSEMIRLGAQVADTLCSNPDIAALHDHQICRRNVVDVHLTTLSARGSDEDWWLTALHTVYDDNVHDIQAQVTAVAQRVSPVRAVMTTHFSKSHLLKQACAPWHVETLRAPTVKVVDIRFLPHLSGIARVRASLHAVVLQAAQRSSNPDSLGIAASYLQRTPTWFQSMESTSCVSLGWERST